MLASQTGITNSGLLDARGGPGGQRISSGSGSAEGGGGGGGIVHLLAPSVVAGTIDVSGGAAGSNGGLGTVAGSPNSGGGGGGASGGRSGNGAGLNGTTPLGNATAGDPGHAITSLLDPTSLL